MRVGGSAERPGSCENRQVVRVQVWRLGHLVFLKSPRLVNITAGRGTRFGTVQQLKEFKEWRNRLGYFRITRYRLKSNLNVQCRGRGMRGCYIITAALRSRRPLGTTKVTLTEIKSDFTFTPTLHPLPMATKRNTKQRARAGSIKDQLERIEFASTSSFR